MFKSQSKNQQAAEVKDKWELRAGTFIVKADDVQSKHLKGSYKSTVTPRTRWGSNLTSI